MWEPEIFSKRGRINLKQLASIEIVNMSDSEATSVMVLVKLDRGISVFHLERRTKRKLKYDANPAEQYDKLTGR